MTKDGLNALQIQYNFLNLTAYATNNSGAVQAQYRWLADGTKAGVKDGAGTQDAFYLMEQTNDGWQRIGVDYSISFEYGTIKRAKRSKR